MAALRIEPGHLSQGCGSSRTSLAGALRSTDTASWNDQMLSGRRLLPSNPWLSGIVRNCFRDGPGEHLHGTWRNLA